jgi:hypothetical protein
MAETKKALRALFKKNDLPASIQYMCNLKGIGPATASAIITAAAPDRAVYMADECLAAVPEIEGIDYTLTEYLELLKHITQAVARLGPSEWNPHQVELALWTHNILLTHKPELLKSIPGIGDGIVRHYLFSLYIIKKLKCFLIVCSSLSRQFKKIL